jgi:hypothetical protein
MRGLVSVDSTVLGSRFALVVLLPCLVVASAGLTACGSKNSHDTTTTTAANATSTTLPTRDAAVIDGYRQFWASYIAAAHPMNPSDPALAQHATGEELTSVRNNFLSRQSAGQDIRGTIDLAPHVTSSTDTQATVADCYFDHTQHFATATNTPVDSVDTARQSVTATLVYVDGAWKVQSIRHEGTGCVATP